MSDQVMTVSDIHGWGEDPDLAQLKPDWPVRVEMISTYNAADEYVESFEPKVDTYERLYREHGAWALPPIVCMFDGGWQIAGAHRMQAAWRAGLAWIPAFIVDMPD